MHENGNEREKLDRLRHGLSESRDLAKLEQERALLSMEILESVLLRIGQLQARVEQLEARLGPPGN